MTSSFLLKGPKASRLSGLSPVKKEADDKPSPFCYTEDMNTAIVGRFAPSPSGYMHMGNLLAMLLAWLDCRALGGELVFRMEDLDPARSKRAYVEALGEDLRWLGLDWDRGWPDPDYAQSRRTARYEEAFAVLRERGLVYPCWCTRSERLAAASAPHPGETEHDSGCRCAQLDRAERDALLRSGRRCAWKLRCPDEPIAVEDGHYGLYIQNPAREVGDCILRRADGVFAYQLAVSVDDGLMGVTRVVQAARQPEHPGTAADDAARGADRPAGFPVRPAGSGRAGDAARAAGGLLLGTDQNGGYPPVKHEAGAFHAGSFSVRTGIHTHPSICTKKLGGFSQFCHKQFYKSHKNIMRC